MSQTLIGKITHYFDKIGVAVLSLTDGSVKIGDTIQVGEPDSGFTQTIDSMQVDHLSVSQAKKGDEVGLKVTQAVKPNTPVSKID